MTEKELADKLRPLHNDTDGLGETRFHLFGIRYHEEFGDGDRKDGKRTRVWEASGGERGKFTHLSYGIKLGKYVQIRGDDLPPSLAFLAE